VALNDILEWDMLNILINGLQQAISGLASSLIVKYGIDLRIHTRTQTRVRACTICNVLICLVHLLDSCGRQGRISKRPCTFPALLSYAFYLLRAPKMHPSFNLAIYLHVKQKEQEDLCGYQPAKTGNETLVKIINATRCIFAVQVHPQLPGSMLIRHQPTSHRHCLRL
jgi:hypothetical protein